jgi:hypothetical protein
MNIETLSLNELLDLNKRVVAAIRHKNTQIGLAFSADLRVGDPVSFKGRNAWEPVIRGYVEKINYKTVKVRAVDKGGIWRVSSTLLTKGH